MDEKAEQTTMARGAQTSKFVGISMLLLTLLLTVSVASLIYLAVANTHVGNQKQEKNMEAVDIKADITVKDTKKEQEDRIEYSHGGHLMYNYQSDGGFDFDDLGKGIHVTKNPVDPICYIIPVGSNRTIDHGLDNFLQSNNGGNVVAKETQIEIEVVPGKLSDTSFLPQKVHDECTSGYQWMVILKNSENENQGDGTELNREKREIEYWHLHEFWWYCTDEDDDLYRCTITYLHKSDDCTYPYDCMTYLG
ncbi:uncharacterized protein [Watersipora subatra]|uniref:uncharacterized protein n=1 Tax=Watersipora subatra TaxID=2589382 RepID=UPI00355BF4DA